MLPTRQPIKASLLWRINRARSELFKPY